LQQYVISISAGQGEMLRVIAVVSRKIAGLIIPVSILTAAAYCLPQLSALPSPWKELLPHIPPAAISIGLLLSFHFRRGRVFLALLLLAALHWAANTRLPGAPAIHGQNAFRLLAILFPFNITLFMFMRERGVLTVAGRIRFLFIAFQAGMVAWLLYFHPGGVALFLARDIALPFFPDAYALSLPALLLLAISFPVAALRLAFSLSPVNSALLGTMAAVAAVCGQPTTPELPMLFITAAALALTLGVLQDTHDMAFRDDLTGLPSRRALNERITDLAGRYVIAMLDVDHFKNFNDAYGHDVGDQVLKMVARKIHGVKGGGRPYRYGGEEFTVIFPRRRLDEAIPHLEEVRKAIAAYQLVLRDDSRPEMTRQGKRQRGSGEGETVSVTISIGVAESNPPSTPADVLKEADQALYRAKRKGRDILSK
jgi:diguanylate cyclase (GGDEF)-like protein